MKTLKVQKAAQPEPYVFKYTIGKNIPNFGENAVVEVVCNEDRLAESVDLAYACIDSRLFELSDRMLAATELGKDLPDDVNIKLIQIMNTIFGQAQKPQLVKREQANGEEGASAQEAQQDYDTSTPA